MLEILALDDHPEVVRRQWNDAGLNNLAILHATDEIHSLEEALAYVQYYQPDIILLDYYMGEVTGDVVLRHIEERYPDMLCFGNSSVEGKFHGLVNVDKDGGKLFDSLIPLIQEENQKDD